MDVQVGRVERKMKEEAREGKVTEQEKKSVGHAKTRVYGNSVERDRKRKEVFGLLKDEEEEETNSEEEIVEE
jgi:hypothetical protein